MLPFFFKNDQGEAVTVNGDRYRVMWNTFLFTKIEIDGGTCHTAEATFDVLRPGFEDHIISRRPVAVQLFLFKAFSKKKKVIWQTL